MTAGDALQAKSKATEALSKDAENAKATELLASANQAQIATLLKEARGALAAGETQRAQEKANAVLSQDFAISESKAEAKRILEEASKKSENVWANSTSRKAGTRQTLEIGDAKYGFCWIPAGEFDMGSSLSEEGHYDDETLHDVELTKGFWMLETPVPQSLYEEVMKENPSKFEGDNLPVECVSWDETMEFCAELTKRLPSGLTANLPTEAQWEYACRAGTKTAYWYGDVADKSKMNFGHPFFGKTCPVKSYAPNAWCLYDMHGNVYEWVLDYYGDYPTGPVVDPKGPDTASYRVIRGGSWDYDAGDCRSALRYRRTPDYRGSNLGFRFLLSCD